MIRQHRMGLAVVAVGLLALGADDPTREIRAGGVTFSVPRSWKSEEPSSRMRLAQIKVGPEKGDDEAAELAIFAFPGGGGTVQQNLDRWKGQFKAEGGKGPEFKTDDRKGKNV